MISTCLGKTINLPYNLSELINGGIIMKNSISILAGSILLSLLAGCSLLNGGNTAGTNVGNSTSTNIGNSTASNSNRTDTGTTNKPGAIQAAAFTKDFFGDKHGDQKYDHESGDKKYKGKTLTITGKISEFGYSSGAVYIRLEGDDPDDKPLARVDCVFAGDSEAAAVKQLQKGQEITVTGTYDSFEFGLRFVKCKIEK